MTCSEHRRFRPLPYTYELGLKPARSPLHSESTWTGRRRPAWPIIRRPIVLDFRHAKSHHDPGYPVLLAELLSIVIFQ